MAGIERENNDNKQQSRHAYANSQTKQRKSPTEPLSVAYISFYGCGGPLSGASPLVSISISVVIFLAVCLGSPPGVHLSSPHPEDGSTAAQWHGTTPSTTRGQECVSTWARTRRSTTLSCTPFTVLCSRFSKGQKITSFADVQTALQRITSDAPGPGQRYALAIAQQAHEALC